MTDTIARPFRTDSTLTLPFPLYVIWHKVNHFGRHIPRVLTTTPQTADEAWELFRSHFSTCDQSDTILRPRHSNCMVQAIYGDGTWEDETDSWVKHFNDDYPEADEDYDEEQAVYLHFADNAAQELRAAE